MSKASRERNKKKRLAAKKARKALNYARCGPKAGQQNKKKKKTVGEGNCDNDAGVSPVVKTSAKGRAKRRRNGLKWSRKTR